MAVSRKTKSMNKSSRSLKRKTIMKGSGVFGRIAKTLHLTRNKNGERITKAVANEWKKWENKKKKNKSSKKKEN